MKRTILAVALALATTAAQAEKFSLGWMNIQPCTKTEWNNNGIFGLPSPTVRHGEQRATLYLSINAPNFQQVQGHLKHCAERGVVAATLASLVTNLSGAAPAFWSEFQSCTTNTQWGNASLSVESSCHWY